MSSRILPTPNECTAGSAIGPIPNALPAICVLKWGGLGSVITTRPMLDALRAAFGRTHRIVYVTSTVNAPLVARMGLTDQVFVLNPDGCTTASLFRMRSRLRQAGVTIFLDLQIHTHRRLASIVARLSGAKERFGFFRPRERPLAADFAIYANPFAPLDRLYLAMAHRLGASLPVGRARADSLEIGVAERNEAQALLQGWLPGSAKLLIVNPNASPNAYVRRWPLSSHAETCSILLRKIPGLRVLLIGSQAETDYVAELARLLAGAGNRVKNVAGLTSLGALLALLQRADCLLSVDSGPLHLGVALDVPVVGLFGPVHPDHNARLGRSARKIILYQPVLCSPCVHQVEIPPCQGENICMKSINPDNVANACHSLIFAEPAASRQIEQEWHFSPSESQPPRNNRFYDGAMGTGASSAEDTSTPMTYAAFP